MARTLGNNAALSATSTSPVSTPAAGVAAPSPAVRVSRPGWRDPRLWVGIAIVAACIVAGARLLGSADDTVAVWAMKADAGTGAVLSRSDLEPHRVHFAAAGDLAGYFRADAALPDQLALTRGVGGGELLPRSAVATATASDEVQVPLAVDPAQVPPAVRSGSIVDVYVVGGPGSTGGNGDAAPALSAVTVVAAPGVDDAFGGSQTKRQLTLAVPERRVQSFFGLIGGLDDPTITVVLRPAG